MAAWTSGVMKNFNPRSREGSDPSTPVAPFTPAYFNPRSREGSDMAPIRVWPWPAFQSTLP